MISIPGWGVLVLLAVFAAAVWAVKGRGGAR